MDDKNNTNLQESTEKENPFEKLEEKYQRAILLRLDFFKYRYIANELKVQEQTARQWFEEGGICKEAYDYMIAMRKKDNAELVQKTREELEDMTPEAINVIRAALASKDVRTAFEILGINGISAIKKVEVDTKNKEEVNTFSNIIDALAAQIKDDDKSTDNRQDKVIN